MMKLHKRIKLKKYLEKNFVFETMVPKMYIQKQNKSAMCDI